MNPLQKFPIETVLRIREKLILLIAMREYCAEVGCEYDVRCNQCKYIDIADGGCMRLRCPEIKSTYDLSCPLCVLRVDGECELCPWLIFEARACKQTDYINCNPQALIRCTNWLQLLDGYILDLYGH